MKTNKILKYFSIILECSFIGSMILYIYNFYVSSKKYEIIPNEIKSRLNNFIIIAIISLILFLILKYVLYIINKPVNENIQLQMDLDTSRENKYKNLEAPITERVFVYKNEYDVPKDKQMVCPNCGNIIDKNAFICIKCGFLLKKLPREKVVERVIEKNNNIKVKPVRNTNYVNNNVVSKSYLNNMIINIGLLIAIIICLILILDLAAQRGII